MTIILTCDCGARFEVDSEWAGRELPCPDCGAVVRAPGGRQKLVIERPSWMVLVSLALILLGAFTITGTLAGVTLAAWSLIRRQPGMRPAMIAIGLGVVLTCFTLFAYWKPSALPIGPWLRYQVLALQIDTSGSDVLSTADGALTLNRPKGKWGRATNNQFSDPSVGDLQRDTQLLLGRIDERAFVDVRKVDGKGDRPLTEIGEWILDELSGQAPEVVLNHPMIPFPPRGGGRIPTQQLSTRRLDLEEDTEGREWTFESRRGNRSWQFVIVALRRKGERNPSRPTYLVRIYAPQTKFTRLEPELRAILESVKLSR
ncbi:MAG: hypothetical protein EBV06_07275 [Planctomycetia bacterium]|nr:hypothetical protein [Planctomycetia bacterium]